MEDGLEGVVPKLPMGLVPAEYGDVESDAAPGAWDPAEQEVMGDYEGQYTDYQDVGGQTWPQMGGMKYSASAPNLDRGVGGVSPASLGTTTLPQFKVQLQGSQ